MEITLTKDVRALQRREPGARQLIFIGDGFRKGTTIEVGTAVEMFYDHRQQTVLPTSCNEQEYFVILSEIGNLNGKA